MDGGLDIGQGLWLIMCEGDLVSALPARDEEAWPLNLPIATIATWTIDLYRQYTAQLLPRADLEALHLICTKGSFGWTEPCRD